MRNLRRFRRLIVLCVVVALAVTASVFIVGAAFGDQTCNDNTISHTNPGTQGACSHHGGVKTGGTPNTEAPTTVAPATTPATQGPASTPAPGPSGEMPHTL